MKFANVETLEIAQAVAVVGGGYFAAVAGLALALIAAYALDWI